MKKIMAKRLKELRLSRGMTQEAVGKIIGVQKAAIQKYEKGDVENIKTSSIKKLSEFYGVSPAYILGFAEKTEEEKKLGEILKIFRERPEIEELFNMAKGVTADEVKKAIKIIKTVSG